MTGSLRSAEIAAGRTTERRATFVLNARESEVFVKSLLDPASPGPVLLRAARDYRRKTASTAVHKSSTPISPRPAST